MVRFILQSQVTVWRWPELGLRTIFYGQKIKSESFLLNYLNWKMHYFFFMLWSIHTSPKTRLPHILRKAIQLALLTQVWVPRLEIGSSGPCFTYPHIRNIPKVGPWGTWRYWEELVWPRSGGTQPDGFNLWQKGLKQVAFRYCKEDLSLNPLQKSTGCFSALSVVLFSPPSSLQLCFWCTQTKWCYRRFSILKLESICHKKRMFCFHVHIYTHIYIHAPFFL